jgi:hypothetical protein
MCQKLKWVFFFFTPEIEANFRYCWTSKISNAGYGSIKVKNKINLSKYNNDCNIFVTEQKILNRYLYTGENQDTLPGFDIRSLSGFAHRYQLCWNAWSVDFSIDIMIFSCQTRNKCSTRTTNSIFTSNRPHIVCFVYLFESHPVCPIKLLNGNAGTRCSA